MSNEERPTNRLAQETSPYLLQHAHNPVDWFPWGTKALRLAQLLDKPILLSVGYSACHWCHVMERESFEDEATAAMMNRYFVNIKVDREERPDVDEIYMRAVQALTGGHGGWPMTVFLTPDGKPFFGGTYFPPEPRHGMPGFKQVLAHVHMLWKHNRPEVERVTQDLSRYLEQTGRLPAAAARREPGWLDRLAEAAHQDFDEHHAGFGGAPKFPPHGTLAALLAHHWTSGEARSLEMATRTLDAMAKGGMYDLAGGGFARYSVDAEWRIPHFEKMLYDNAQLVPIYLDAWRATGRPWYRRIVVETLDYVLREMTHPEGGFCAAQDADSEGVEGRFFVWTPAQLEAALGGAAPRVAELLQVTAKGSFEHGASVLRLEAPREALSPADRALVEDALPRLFAARAERVPPARDDKVITAWNALMIGALARAGAALGEPRYTEAASRATAFLLDSLVQDGRLLRTWRAGKAHLLAYADDHAFLVDALVDLHQATQDLRWLYEANRLADELVRLFWDDEGDGLFYTGSDAEELVVRSKNMLGGATPSANGVAALAFARLAVLCGREDLGARSDRILLRFQPLLERAPRALGPEAIAAAWRAGLGRELAIAGDEPKPFLAELRRRHQPLLLVATAPPADSDRLPWLEGKAPLGGATTAFLCRGFACRAPTTDPAELGQQLDEHPVEQARHGSGRDPAPPLPQDPDAWLNTSRPLALEDLRGNVVVLDFWTYCCVNCLHVQTELAAVETRYAGEPVAVIGVHSPKFPAEKERDNVERAIARHGLRHPVVLDPEHRLWREYAVGSWPTVMVLDAQGRVAWAQPGEVDQAKLFSTIDRLLDEARAEGALAPPAVELVTARQERARLRFPGKVRVYAGAAQQQAGEDAFADGRLYVADTGHHRVIEAALARGADGWPTARVLRVFGTTEPGLRDGKAARFREPQGLDRSGQTLWVADTGNHALRAVDLGTGEVRTVAGTGELRRGQGGAADRPRSLPLRSPWDVAAAGTEAGMADQELVFIAMAGSNQLWVYMPGADRIGPIAGSGKEDHVDGDPPEAAFAQPSGLELFGQYLFVADSEDSSVRVFDMAEQKVSTVVGRGLFDFGDVDGQGDAVRLQHPLAVTAAGASIYVADTFNGKVKVIDMADRSTRTLAGGAGALWEPGGLAPAGEFLIVADTNNHRLRALRRDTGDLRDLTFSWPD